MPLVAVFGGVYANPHALRAVLADAAARGCTASYCLGDLGGFGAECDAVWPLLTDAGAHCIAGNYDQAIGRGDSDCGCGYADARDNHYAQLLYDYTRAHTSPAFAAWMRRLPGTLRARIGGADVLMVHGSPLAVNDFLWESLSDADVEARIAAAGAPRPDVLLCTHTGLPWQRRVGGTLVVNVGAIGRPANDGTPDVVYAVLEIEHGAARAQLVGVGYDWRAQAAAMRAAGLPDPFAETIETGWWTTCLEVVPPRERSRGAYQVYREALPVALGPAGLDWAGTPAPPGGDERPVVALFGTPLFPPRLWVYSNFHCNLACDYCVVASSPHARPRQLDAERFGALVDEAVAEGFSELYVTGGEPFVHPQIVELLEYASDRLETVVLTNAMLFAGRRRRDLERLAGRARLTLQSSIDGADAATHDRWRGSGSWARAMAGLRDAAALGLPLRVAMTETPDNRHEVDALRALLADLGVAGDAFSVRPLVRRGFAAGLPGAIAVSDAVMVPELTITADGAHWHPVGGDRDACPDFVVAEGPVALAEAKRRIVERFLALRQADGTLPQAFHCAV